MGGDDEILANWQIEMLRSDVYSVPREKFGVGILGGLHLIWSYSPTVYIFISKRSFGLDLNPYKTPLNTHDLCCLDFKISNIDRLNRLFI